MRRAAVVAAALCGFLAALPAAWAGGGGSPPDLTVTKSVSAATAQVGDQLTYVVAVKLAPDKGLTATATEIVLTDVLPAGTQLVSTYADRGGGCSGTTTLTCNLDFLSGDQVARVTIVVRVTQTGELVNTATVRSGQTDPVTTNNSASARTTVVQPTPPAPPPPTASHPGPPRVTPSRSGVRASRFGGVSEAAFRIFVDEPARVTVQVVGANGRARRLLERSRLASERLSGPATRLVVELGQASVIAAKLRLATPAGGRRVPVRAVITATDGNGETATTVVRISL